MILKISIGRSGNPFKSISMHIEINDTTTIRSIQDTFSNFYPYLQIEFYLTPHPIYGSSDERELIYGGKIIGEVKQTHLSSFLEILPFSRAANIEKEFLNRLGLSVQILVKQNDKWEQTTDMDDFTIKELNELGRSSSDEFILSDPDTEYSDDL